MTYLINTENSFGNEVADLLSKEIERFDIRSDLQRTGNNKEALSLLKNTEVDLFIHIGTAFPRKVCKLKGLKTCFLFQSVRTKNDLASERVDGIDWVFYDLPLIQDKQNYAGNWIFELVKSKSRVVSNNDLQLSGPKIVLAHGYKQSKAARSLQAMLSSLMSDSSIVLANLDAQLEHSIHELSQSNAAVAMDDFSELVALATNCPLVRTIKKSFFRKAKPALINRLSNKEIVKVADIKQGKTIKNELDLIVKDHHHCAGIMQDYQAVREILGNQPAIRAMAKSLVEGLEEASF